MEAKELVNFRIGNYILDINANKIIKMDFGTFESIHYNINHKYVPVKLNESLLFKLGFECKDTYDDYYYQKGTFQLDRNYQLFDSEIEIECLHELQNIYFALTGKELEIDEN